MFRSKKKKAPPLDPRARAWPPAMRGLYLCRLKYGTEPSVIQTRWGTLMVAEKSVTINLRDPADVNQFVQAVADKLYPIYGERYGDNIHCALLAR